MIGLSETYKASRKFVLGVGNSTLQVNPKYTIDDGNNGENYVVNTVSSSGTISLAARQERLLADKHDTLRHRYRIRRFNDRHRDDHQIDRQY